MQKSNTYHLYDIVYAAAQAKESTVTGAKELDVDKGDSGPLPAMPVDVRVGSGTKVTSAGKCECIKRYKPNCLEIFVLQLETIAVVLRTPIRNIIKQGLLDCKADCECREDHGNGEKAFYELQEISKPFNHAKYQTDNQVNHQHNYNTNHETNHQADHQVDHQANQKAHQKVDTYDDNQADLYAYPS
ncbi:hypothetical protein MRX96_026706 [Rhipicephalus microplus]